jgi:hypothetical protein
MIVGHLAGEEVFGGALILPDPGTRPAAAPAGARRGRNVVTGAARVVMIRICKVEREYGRPDE